ncbi:MAG: T9SS type B sorting domain-containing protein, partial [Flavobacteriales bacterium]|nr:T9SS type B sorting domain-containing protein [Flavobacteriales bacterium]
GIGIIEEDFRLSIFNRWGDLIYTTTNLHAGWDGKYKGLMMKNDVYVYKVELKDIFNKTHHSIGHFTLVR